MCLTVENVSAFNNVIGQWISKDPIGEQGGVNLDGFVGDDPLNAFDALGWFASRFHRSTTESGLRGRGLDAKCIATIVRANVGQDDGAVVGFFVPNTGPFSDPLNHGDNSQIGETIGRIRERFTAISRQHCLKCEDVDEMLRLFGMILHGLQDLYAHSTYVETFAQNVGVPQQVPLWRLSNADGVANVPAGVISGPYACPRDNAPGQSHRLISKDEPGSPRGSQTNSVGVTWFTLAEDVATRHTGELWKELVRRLSPEQKKTLVECRH